MLITILTVIGSLLILSIFISVHELGHFCVGKLFHFKIKEFSIGMGPKIFEKQGRDSSFSMRAFPIGGMCQFNGEDEEAENEESFNSHPAWQRLLVVLAGPVMNILLAFLLAFLFFLFYGKSLPKIQSFISEEQPAYKSGLQIGDIIEKVNGEEIVYFNEATSLIRDADSNDLVIGVIRDNKTRDVLVSSVYNEEYGYNYLGITMEYSNVTVPFFKCFPQAFKYIFCVFKETIRFFGNLFSGKVQSTDIAGPVGTVAYISNSFKYGFDSIVNLGILINVSLGIMNILPLPALDGGRLIFILIEIVFKKPVSRDKEGMVHFIGLILLFALIIFLSYNDIVNLINGVLI